LPRSRKASRHKAAPTGFRSGLSEQGLPEGQHDEIGAEFLFTCFADLTGTLARDAELGSYDVERGVLQVVAAEHTRVIRRELSERRV